MLWRRQLIICSPWKGSRRHRFRAGRGPYIYFWKKPGCPYQYGKVMQDAFGADKAGAMQCSQGHRYRSVLGGTKDKQTLMKLAEEVVVKRLLSVIGIQKEPE